MKGERESLTLRHQVYHNCQVPVQLVACHHILDLIALLVTVTATEHWLAA